MLFTIYNVLSGTLIFVTGLIIIIVIVQSYNIYMYICFISYVENSGRDLSHWRSTYRRRKSENNTMLELPSVKSIEESRFVKD